MKTKLLIQLFTLLTLPAIAQVEINGLVKDEQGELIIGANVFLKDTYDGTSTDVEGRFSFPTAEEGEQTLVVSYLGYENWEQIILIKGPQALSFEVQIKPSASELDVVVITAGAFEASDEKKGVVLRTLDIVTTAGATADIAGALNTLPGTQAVGEEGRLFVRGGAAAETRTFIDGMFVQNPYNSSVPNLPTRGRFSPFLFKGTTFSTGGYSAEYGQALSSALILDTRDLAPETVTGISLMSVGLNLSHTQRWEKSSLSVSLDHFNLGPYTALVPQNIDWETPFHGTSGQVIFRQKTSETGIFKIHANFNQNGFALQYPLDNDVNQTNELELTNQNFYVNSSFREILGDKWSLFGGISYTRNSDDVRQQFQLDALEQSAQGKFTLSYQMNESIRMKFGGEYLFNDFDENFLSTDLQAFNTRLKEQYSAAFWEADIYLSNHLVTRVGLRTEYSDILQNWNIAPRVSIAYKTGKDSQISLAYGQFFQNPEKEHLRYQTNLDFERADHYMLNYQIIKNARTFRIEGYYKAYKNLLKFAANAPWLSENSGDGFARGIDVFYRDQRSVKNGDFWLSYSFLDTERNYRDFPERATPYFASKHNFSVVYKHWIPKCTTSLGFTYSLASPRSFNNPNTEAFNAERTAIYQDLSFNASYLTSLFGQFTIFYFSINNIPGYENNFGIRYSDTPDENGQFVGTPIEPPAKRFVFLGIFISIGGSTIN